MINSVMIKKMVKHFITLVSILALYSCATIDQRFANQDDAIHPGMQVFLDYQQAITTDSEFDDGIQSFFSEAGRKKIAASQGWHKLVYTASFRGLKSGSCDELSILNQSSNFILVSCKGPYAYRSAFGFGREETMHLRVYVRKNSQGWYVDNGGLTHTMDGGQSVPRSIGLKFPK